MADDRSTVVSAAEGDAPPTVDDGPIGQVVGGYLVQAVAGAGGMGVVYRATDPALGRSVALKLISPERSGDPRFRDLFIRESLAAASLEHPNVIPIYRAGEEDGRLYIAMRFVEGASLRDLLAGGRGLPPGRAARVIARVGDALDAAHARGLVHRDVKPGNILIADPEGEEHVYLTDFGLSVPARRSVEGDPGRWSGTLSCLAPEQIRGGTLDARTDVYALGCALFQALTGRAPFPTDDEATALEAHLTQRPPAPSSLEPGLPPAFDEVVRRAMAKRPEDRYQSAGELGRAALAARYDVVILSAEDQHREATDVADRLREAGLLPLVPSSEPGAVAEAVRASGACLVLVGAGGLGGWAREGLAAATALAARDRAFRLALVLLPGAPDPTDPGLVFLATHPWVDLRAGLTDPLAGPDLVRALRGAEVAPGLPASGDALPYRGLESFREEDAGIFFGREQDTSRLLERLRAARFLAVLGPSGSGKSSLVHAGLLPALRSGAIAGATGWRIIEMVPGAHPLAALCAQLAGVPGAGSPAPADLAADERSLDLALARALEGRPGDERALVLVDQLEEAFTLCSDAGERAAFLANLAYAAAIPGGRCVVVAAMRADFYHRLAEHPQLRELVAGQNVLVGPLDAKGLRRAIEEPARRAGLDLEPGLTRRILTDVSDRPGTLPLLEHLLLELWHRRRGRTLTLAAYADSGGVEGALARRANAIYGAMSPERQAIARRVLLRLTQPGEGTEDTRRRAELRELVTRPEEAGEVEAVVAALAEGRLLTTGRDETTGQPVVEVTHEALIRGWPELRGWIGEDREQLRQHRRLSDAAAEWEASGREEGQLHRGARLAIWQERGRSDLNEMERAFLAESEGRAERDRLSRRRRVSALVGGLTAAAVVIAGIAVFAFIQRNDAAGQRDVALSRQIAASAREQLSRDPELSLLLANEAYSDAPTNEAAEILRRATQESRGRRVLSGHKGPVTGASFSPGGRRVATAGEDGTIRVWDLGEDADPRILSAGGPVNGVAFTSDGDILSAQENGDVRIWDLPTGVYRILGRHRGPALSVSPSRAGHRVVSSGKDGTVRVWSLDDATAPIVLSGIRGPVAATALSPDASRVAAGGTEDPAVRLWELRRPHDPQRLEAVSGGISGVDFSPDGRRILGASESGQIFVWSLPDLGRPIVLRGHATSVRDAAFSSDGVGVVSAGLDGTLRVWDISSPTVASAALSVIRGHSGPVNSASFSPDGRRVLSAGDDGTARIWDWGGGLVASVSLPQRAQTTPLGPPSFTPDGTHVLRALGDGSAEFWDPRDGTLKQAIPPSGLAISALLTPDGRGIVTGGRGQVRLRDVQIRGRMLSTVLRAGRGIVPGLALSTEQALLAAGSSNGIVRVWDLADPGAPRMFTGNAQAAIAVALSSDGSRVASAGADGTVRVWRVSDPASGIVVQRHDGLVFDVAFSPDGRHLAAAAADGSADVTDLDTGQTTQLRGYARGVGGVAFSPDGTLLATAADEGVRVWDWARAQVVLRVQRPSPEAFVAFAPSGNRFATFSFTGKLNVWSCEVCGPIEEVRTLAQTRVQRALTVQERDVFNLGGDG